MDFHRIKLCITAITTLLIITNCKALTSKDVESVPLAIVTSDVIQFAPAKVGAIIPAGVLSGTTVASVAENVENLVVIVVPKLSFSRLTFDATYNNKQDTQALSGLLSSMNSIIYPAVSHIDQLSLGGSPKTIRLTSSLDLPTDDILKGGRVRLELESWLSLYEADTILGKVVELLKSNGHSFGVIYTANKADHWIKGIPVEADDNFELRHQRFRRQAAPKPTEAVVIASSNEPDCFLLYAKQINITLTIPSTDPTTVAKPVTEILPGGRTNVSTEGTCADGKNFSLEAKFTMNNFKPLVLKFIVKKANFWEWQINVTVDATYNGKSYPGDFGMTWMTAQKKFSYHCNTPGPLNNKKEKGTPTKAVLEVKFDTVQVQAYDVANGKFSYPCDCVGFFTSAIWSGIIVTIIYLLIIALALVMLVNLETMDRFEDPKGQGLKIQASG